MLDKIWGMLGGNPAGELRICPDCHREHDIKRGTCCWCACGKLIKSKEFSIGLVNKLIGEIKNG